MKTIFRYLVSEIWSILYSKFAEIFSQYPILLVTSSKCVSEDSMEIAKKLQKKIVDKFFQETKIRQKRIKKNQIYHICKIKNRKIVFS